MAFLYETHLHTFQGSACGRSSGKEHAQYYKSLGYQGIFVTDHFYGGNTAVPRDLPWSQWVEEFCKGYEDAREEGERIGLDVFFGWEQGYGDDEYLVYGLDKAWLLAHPEIADCSRADQLRLVHEGGGCVIQAHPFRMRGYIKHIRLGRMYCDGIEVANAANGQINDAAARRYAKTCGLLMTAGSDNHHSPAHSEAEVYGVAWEEKLTSAVDYAKRLRGGLQPMLRVPDGRFDVTEQAKLEAFWLNEREELESTGIDWLTV